MGFNIPFYMIFGTNLLTESPVQIVVFCLFQCFAEKESKRNETFARIVFGTNAIQETWSGCQEAAEVATRQEGGPPTLVGPSWLP